MGSSIWSSTVLERRWFEHDSLAVAFAMAFRLDAVFAYWSFLTTLDATFATRQASRLGSFTREFGLQGSLSLAGVSAIDVVFVVAVVVGRVVPGAWIHEAKVDIVAEWSRRASELMLWQDAEKSKTCSSPEMGERVVLAER